MRPHRWLGPLLGMVFLLAASLAHANIAYHTVDKVVRTATGAQIHVLMNSAPGYNGFSVGITSPSGNRYSGQQYSTHGRANGVAAAIIVVPYTQYRSGQQVRVISSWSSPYRTHNWGNDPGSVVTLP